MPPKYAKSVLSPEHYQLVMRLTPSTYETNFQRHKNRLKAKFEKLLPKAKPSVNNRPSLIKNPVLQLQSDPLPPAVLALLSLGPKFALTPKSISKMDIIEEVESSCLSLERHGKQEKAEDFRHDMADILLKAKPPKPNLTKEEQKGMSYLKKSKERLAIVPFDKGQGLVSIEREKLVEKSEKEFKNVSLDTEDTTKSHQTKIQRKTRELHKQGKIDDETYKRIYPSVSLTPTANPVIKAHKANKDYPARLITSHIGAPQENLASLINDILKPIIESNPLVCKNSTQFVQEIKNIQLGPNERMVSFDATALFPSVPIGDATKLIHDILEQDQTLIQRTKLSPTEICDLISLCLQSSNFIYNGRHHTQRDSGPIGLSLMVTVSQLWMLNTMEKAIAEAKKKEDSSA